MSTTAVLVILAIVIQRYFKRSATVQTATGEKEEDD